MKGIFEQFQGHRISLGLLQSPLAFTAQKHGGGSKRVRDSAEIFLVWEASDVAEPRLFFLFFLGLK